MMNRAFHLLPAFFLFLPVQSVQAAHPNYISTSNINTQQQVSRALSPPAKFLEPGIPTNSTDTVSSNFTSDSTLRSENSGVQLESNTSFKLEENGTFSKVNETNKDVSDNTKTYDDTDSNTASGNFILSGGENFQGLILSGGAAAENLVFYGINEGSKDADKSNDLYYPFDSIEDAGSAFYCTKYIDGAIWLRD